MQIICPKNIKKIEYQVFNFNLFIIYKKSFQAIKLKVVANYYH
jgi:hypothetical protein